MPAPLRLLHRSFLPRRLTTESRPSEFLDWLPRSRAMNATAPHKVAAILSVDVRGTNQTEICDRRVPRPKRAIGRRLAAGVKVIGIGRYRRLRCEGARNVPACAGS